MVRVYSNNKKNIFKEKKNILEISRKEKLNIEGEITKSFEKYPYTQTYDCSSNFAPITLFNYEEMINFK